MIIKKIERAFNLTYDLIKSLSEDQLLLRLNELPSNRICDQIWCIVGARESYFNAVKNGGWCGFSCSLREPQIKENSLNSLDNSSSLLIKYCIARKLDVTQFDYLFDLLEHELQHHGQLIRYIYGNRLKFPESWKRRYSV